MSNLNRMEELAIIVDLVRRMRSKKGWAGETHIQKGVHCLTRLTNVPLTFEFVLYKHGPYSFELHDELVRLLGDQRLLLEPRPPYGPSFGTTRLGEQLRRTHLTRLNQLESELGFVATEIGPLDIGTLERVATALEVSHRNPKSSVNDRSAQLHELKPHIPLDLAVQSVTQVDKLRREFATIRSMTRKSERRISGPTAG